MYLGETGMDEAICKVSPSLKKNCLWLFRARRTSIARAVRVVSLAMGAKVT